MNAEQDAGAGDSNLSPLPSYERAPVVEVVVAMQFERLPRLSNALLGGFWKSLPQDAWPRASDAPFVPPQFEVFKKGTRWMGGPRMHFSSSPQCRIQIRSDTGDRLIQVQNGRVYFNWQKKAGEEYPRFETILEGFIDASKRFMDFTSAADVGAVKPNHWEVTYVNSIPRNTVWATPADWKFFSLLTGVPSIEGVVAGESFNGEWHFAIPENHGRLHIRWDHLRQSKLGESSDAVRLTLTARGPLQLGMEEFAAVVEGAKLGRKTIVTSFRDLMSKDANNFWGLRP